MSDILSVTEQEYMPLRDVVFNTLRQAIIKGELKPGERLLEIQLSEKLGVSRTPVREAIRKLELEGLVVNSPRRGATVAGITKKHLQDVLEIRKALEELAIELACERMDENGFAELERLHKEFISNSENDDSLLLANLDESFHDVIYESTNNPRLVQMLANLREQMYRYRLEYIKAKDKRAMLIAEHEIILKEVKLRHLEGAKKAIRSHIDNQEITVLNSINS